MEELKKVYKVFTGLDWSEEDTDYSPENFAKKLYSAKPSVFEAQLNEAKQQSAATVMGKIRSAMKEDGFNSEEKDAKNLFSGYSSFMKTKDKPDLDKYQKSIEELTTKNKELESKTVELETLGKKKQESLEQQYAYKMGYERFLSDKVSEKKISSKSVGAGRKLFDYDFENNFKPKGYTIGNDGIIKNQNGEAIQRKELGLKDNEHNLATINDFFESTLDPSLIIISNSESGGGNPFGGNPSNNGVAKPLQSRGN